MRAIARSAACAIGLAVAASAATDAEKIRAVLLALSTSLDDGNAARFLGQIDRRRFASYATLEENVVAMVAQNEVGSSIGVLEQAASGEAFDLKLDWLLSLKPASGGAAQQRHQTVTCRLEPSGKGLKVTALAPLDFFKPL
jgi:hypothetical protein